MYIAHGEVVSRSSSPGAWAMRTRSREGPCASAQHVGGRIQCMILSTNKRGTIDFFTVSSTELGTLFKEHNFIKIDGLAHRIFSHFHNLST